MKLDTQIFDLISEERARQMHGIELIASENFVSEQVMNAMGSVLTNKYAEGYPAARYYGGCEIVDKVENLAIERLCQIYGAEYRPIVGGSWNSSAVCGSRAANWNNRSLNLNSNNGARRASDTWVAIMSELTHG